MRLPRQFNPEPSSDFPGGALVAKFVGYALYCGIAAAVVGIIAGAATLAFTTRGHGTMTTHQLGVRALVGGIAGLIILGSIGTIV